jgi:glycosyltransferase involved in cell wall biosynthesis
VRPIKVLSLTQDEFAGYQDDSLCLTHLYASARGGAVGDYITLGRVARHLDTLLRSEPVDVVHLLGLPLALAPLIRRRRTHVVAHVTLAQHAYQGPIEGLRALAGWRLFDRWIDAYAPSSAALQTPLADRGMPASKFCVIPAAIDAGFFVPGNPRAARSALGIGEDESLVVYLGTLAPLRFPATSVGQALAAVGQKLGRTLQLHAFAPRATHSYNRAWSEAAERELQGLAGVSSEVRLCDISPVEKRQWFQAADVVLLPFAAPVAVEPPLTLLEAMACGAAVLVSQEANRSNLVHSGENGFTYHTQVEMVRQLETLLRAPARAREELGVRAREIVVERHSLEAAAGAAKHLWSTWAKDGRPWR